MEAAAKTIQLLTQRILPYQPHNLSSSPDWRYHIPANDAHLKSKKHFEEWDNRRLQYTTLVSEADRGVLMTRPYYDMRVEPAKPVPRELNALAKSGGEKKKLSLSDYKNKKTGVASEAGTPEPASAKKKDVQHVPADSRPVPGIKRPDEHRPREAQQQVGNNKSQKPRENTVVDMRYDLDAVHHPAHTRADQIRLPPKPPAKAAPPPRAMSPDSRKRGADADDELRPPKRPRPDAGRAVDEPSRTPRDEPPRRKDRDTPTIHDRETPRERSTSTLLPNGKGVFKGATGANRVPSPVGRARGDSVNGARPSLNANPRSTPKERNDSSSSKSSVPPLLSPLHLNLESHDAVESRDRKRAREDAIDGTRVVKAAKKPEPPPPPQRKRERSPVELPPLLSPTLPAVLETELSRRKTSTPKPAEPKVRDERLKSKEDRPERERSKTVEKTSLNARKAPLEQDDDESSGKERPRKRRIVTLKIPKKLRQTVERILRLQGKGRNERDASSELPPPLQAPAKKRPLNNSERTEDTISVKRPRPAELSNSSRLPPPSTPSKKATTAMERVSSNNSQVDTPGEGTTATPSAPGSLERSGNGSGVKREIRLARERQAEYTRLGRTLKHRGETVRQNASLHPPDQTNGDGPNHGRVKLGYVYTIESIIAFMESFQSLNTLRALSGKACDPMSWASLLPFLDHITNDLRRRDPQQYHPLYTLVLVLHAVTLEELLKCYNTFENPDEHCRVKDYIKHSRNRHRLYELIEETISSVEGFEDAPTCVHLPLWWSREAIYAETLRVLKSWCSDQGIDWTSEVDKIPRPMVNSAALQNAYGMNGNLN